MILDKKIIKTSLRYWIEEIGGVFAFLIVLPIFAMIYWEEEFYFIGGLGLLIGIASLISNFRSAYNSKIIFTSSEIRGQINKLNFSKSLEDIKALQFSGYKTTSQLIIWTDQDIIQIPCKYFDEKELDKFLKEHLPLEVFHPLAYQKLPQFQESQNERLKQFSNLYQPLSVSLGRSEKIIGSISIFLSIIMVGLLFISENDTIALVMATFLGGLGLFLILWSNSKVEATSEFIKFYSFFKEYELLWNDLKEVYVNTNNQMMALVGDKCRIVLPNPGSWSGKDRDKFFDLLYYKIETLRLQPIESKKHLYWRSKNFET